MKTFRFADDPGLTITLTITRKSDGHYWTGSAWQAGAATVAMSETASYSADYSEYYSETEPTAECWWKALDSNSVLRRDGEYDPYRGASATSSDIAPTLADVKQILIMKTGDSGDDSLITDLASQVGSWIENFCQRRFSSSSRTYVISGDGTDKLYLPDWPITSVTSIYGPCVHYPRHFTSTGGSVQSTELVDSDYYIIANLGQPNETRDHILNIASGSPYGWASGQWDYGKQNFEVVATTGYSSLPADLYSAACELAAWFYRQAKEGLIGITGRTIDAGGSISQAEFERGIPLQQRMVFERYRRWSV